MLFFAGASATAFAREKLSDAQSNDIVNINVVLDTPFNKNKTEQFYLVLLYNTGLPIQLLEIRAFSGQKSKFRCKSGHLTWKMKFLSRT